MSSTSDGLKLFAKLVRWITTILALYLVWVGWKSSSSDFVFLLIIATVIFIAGNGIGWWVQVFAERNR